MDPKNATACWELSQLLTHTGDVQGALDAARQAIEADRDCAEGYFVLGMALNESNDFEGSARAYETAIQKRSFWAEASVNRGNALRRLGKIDEAREAYLRALKSKPNLWEAHACLGRLFFGIEETDAAIQSLQRAMNLLPPRSRSSIVHYGLGCCLWKLGHRKDAEMNWCQAVQLVDRARTSALVNIFGIVRDLGVDHLNRGQPEKARGYLEHYLQRKREDAHGWFGLGVCLGQLGLYEKSLEKLRKAHEAGVRQGEKWDVPSARLVERAKRLVVLAKKLERVLDGEDPGSADDMALLAEIAHARKRYAASVRLYEAAFRLDPGLKTPVEHVSENRLKAAFSAVQAASGLGKEKDTLAPEERERFRILARCWLEEELIRPNEHQDTLEGFSFEPLHLWMIRFHRELDPVRDATALARLPDTERLAWQAFWKKVDTTLESMHEQPR